MLSNKSCVCVATGESLTQDDIDYCQGKADIYAVKEAIYSAPFAKVVYCADGDWWDLKKGLPSARAEKWTCSKEASLKYGLNHIDVKPRELWSINKDYLASGGNSGFQTLNLAALHGYKKIVLLGYDYGFTAQKHFYDGTSLKRESRYSNYKEWLNHMRKAANLMNVEVVNCTRKSTIDCFPSMSIQDAI